MPEHPCAEGLSSACFKAYPEWARKALAYKLLHIILPKQLTRKLTRMIKPPDFVWNESWNAWLNLIFTGDLLPWEYFPEDWELGDPLPEGVEIDLTTVFPEDWTPEDPLPEGVIVTPGVVFPEDWTPDDPLPEGVTLDTSVILPSDFDPEDHPDEFYIPGYSSVETDPETGVEAPIYVRTFEAGPIGGSSSSAAAEFDIGTLLVEQGVIASSVNLGNTDVWSDLAMAITTFMHAEIRAIDIKVGKYGLPDGYVYLEIWRTDADYKPLIIVGSGQSELVWENELPDFSLNQDYIRFLFLDKPILFSDSKYDIVAVTSNTIDGVNYFKVGRASYPNKNYYYKLPAGTWYSQWGGVINCRIWGFAL